MKRVPTTLQALRMAQGEIGWYKYLRDHPERARFYASGAWRAARARHLRQHPTCAICGEPASVVDHRVPISEGGANLDPANLQSVCRRHHQVKTQNESHRGRKRAAKQRQVAKIPRPKRADIDRSRPIEPVNPKGAKS